MPNAASPGHAPVSRWKLFSFAVPAVPISAMGLPLVVHLPPFYAGTFGIGLTTVGAIFMLARFWDVFTDPVLGILSDKFETRWGRRRHWIVLSVPIMMLSVVMIFMPAGGVTPNYLIFWLFVLYAGWTLITISHMSWGAELTPDYNERSRVQGAREVALILGMVFVLTLLILFVPPGEPAIALAVWVLLGVNMAAGPFLFRSIMADVADHDTVITGQHRTGLFYSMLTSTSKFGAPSDAQSSGGVAAD